MTKEQFFTALIHAAYHAGAVCDFNRRISAGVTKYKFHAMRQSILCDAVSPDGVAYTGIEKTETYSFEMTCTNLPQSYFDLLGIKKTDLHENCLANSGIKGTAGNTALSIYSGESGFTYNIPYSDITFLVGWPMLGGEKTELGRREYAQNKVVLWSEIIY